MTLEATVTFGPRRGNSIWANSSNGQVGNGSHIHWRGIIVIFELVSPNPNFYKYYKVFKWKQLHVGMEPPKPTKQGRNDTRYFYTIPTSCVIFVFVFDIETGTTMCYSGTVWLPYLCGRMKYCTDVDTSTIWPNFFQIRFCRFGMSTNNWGEREWAPH